jgi:dUTP pyrophosphatase
MELSNDNLHFLEFLNKTSHFNVMYLSIFVDSNDDYLKQLYINYAKKHNQKILDDPHFYDAGFDVFLPLNNKVFKKSITNKVDFNTKCCAKIYNDNGSYFTPFYTYARSSISKTPLRLANNQGIIDAGYRGNLIGMFDCMEEEYNIQEYSRILQICAPNLIPIYVNIVDTFEELGQSTLRGDGGFGSTGI